MCFCFQVIIISVKAFRVVSSDSICLSSDLSLLQAKIIEIIHFFRFQVITRALKAFLLGSSESSYLSSDSFKYDMIFVFK